MNRLPVREPKPPHRALVGRRRFVVALAGLGLAACGQRATQPGLRPIFTPSQATSATPPPKPTTATAATATAASPTRPTSSGLQPVGFPIDPALRVGIVTGDVGRRAIAWGEGPAAERYSREDQPAPDPMRANRCGWNARVHVEYEGEPAVDWYLPVGAPVRATMDGNATLLVNTVSNPFDVYGVSREPYIGDPDRARAPVAPFPGPGGGQGVFVRIENPSFVTTCAHFDLDRTAKLLTSAAFLPGYSGSADLASLFRPLRDFRTATAIARWTVRRGDVIGFSGDSGYSEAPHLHYTIGRAGGAHLLCPTTEPGFEDSGWLFRE